MIRRWEDDWVSVGQNAAPQYVALSRVFENGELQALIQFHATSQRYFYTVTRFERGVWTEVGGQFPSVEDAKAAA